MQIYFSRLQIAVIDMTFLQRQLVYMANKSHKVSHLLDGGRTRYVS